MYKILLPLFISTIVSILGVLLAYAQTQGTEYPTYHEVPKGLSFSCKDRGPGYFADPDTQCQVWHWCVPSGALYSFLCPNGTVFNQKVRVCDWWFNVDCPSSPDHYKINDDLYKDKDGNYIVGSQQQKHSK